MSYSAFETYKNAISRLSFTIHCMRDKNLNDRTFIDKETFISWKHEIAIPNLRIISSKLFAHHYIGDFFLSASAEIDRIANSLQRPSSSWIESFNKFKHDFNRITITIPEHMLNLDKEINAILKVDSFDFLSALIQIMAGILTYNENPQENIDDLIKNAIKNEKVDYLKHLVHGYMHSFTHTASVEIPRYFNETTIPKLISFLEFFLKQLDDTCRKSTCQKGIKRAKECNSDEDIGTITASMRGLSNTKKSKNQHQSSSSHHSDDDDDAHHTGRSRRGR